MTAVLSMASRLSDISLVIVLVLIEDKEKSVNVPFQSVFFDSFGLYDSSNFWRINAFPYAHWHMSLV